MLEKSAFVCQFSLCAFSFVFWTSCSIFFPRVHTCAQRLDTFKRLLLVRAFRDDRAMQCATKYIMESLGPAFVDTISPSFEGTLDETSWNVPVICLLSMGSDPTSNIVALAKSKKVELRMVSMGQGQEVIARRFGYIPILSS